ncbi:MAG: MarR family transcriptional regulator, partial [Burkholderiales bacterium]
MTRPALLREGSDVDFRRLIYRLLLVEERLRRARDHLGRLAGLTGPQYTMLITVAYLQGATGITVQSLARNLRVTSAFITTE